MADIKKVYDNLIIINLYLFREMKNEKNSAADLMTLFFYALFRNLARGMISIL